MKWIAIPAALSVLLVFGCSKQDQQRAEQRASEARQDIRSEAHKVDQDLRNSVNPNATAEARQKLDNAGATAKADAAAAGAKLDHAALVAKVKARLVSDVGLSSVGNISVILSGSVVTLEGTVSTPAQKQEAEQATSAVEGVTRVVNNLRVQP